MYCKNCGAQIPNDSKFCTYCGSKMENEDVVYVKEDVVNDVELVNNNNEPVNTSKGPWNGFAKAGNVLGIVSICIFWIPIYGLIFAFSLGIPGIVLSSLGKRSTSYRNRANAGLTLSIISLALAFVAYIIFIVILTNSY